MLQSIGLSSADDLFSSIPEDLRLRRPLNTPAALAETELLTRFERLGEKNAGARRISFLGGGAYLTFLRGHHILSFRVFHGIHALPTKSQGTQTILSFKRWFAS